MDKKQTFDWLPAQMPRVATLAKARRAVVGDAHFNECWRRGVVLCEPGWFFAREGGISIGTPDARWAYPELEALPNPEQAALLMLRDKGVSDGAA